MITDNEMNLKVEEFRNWIKTQSKMPQNIGMTNFRDFFLLIKLDFLI